MELLQAFYYSGIRLGTQKKREQLKLANNPAENQEG